MTTRLIPRRRRTRLAVIATALATASLALPGASHAATDNYCISCFIYKNSYVINTRYHYNTVSYVHYLGTGNRWMGAGAWNYGSFLWGWNAVYRSYAGTVNARAAAGFSGTQSGATSNAHANY